MTLPLLLLMIGVPLLVSGFRDLSVREILTGEREDGKDPESVLKRLQALGDVPSSPELSKATGNSIASVTPAGGPTGKGAGLYQLALTAQNQFKLTVREFMPFDKVDPVHVPTSLHYRNKAFDASGTVANMRAFAAYVAQHDPDIDELYWKGPGTVTIKNGKPINPALITGHTDHVHVGKE